jgi:hypothetical protein
MPKPAVTFPFAAAILVAAGASAADPEVCNGLDDDDDGLTDEDVVDCADGEVCFFSCFDDCSGDAGPCDEQHLCIDGVCLIRCYDEMMICPGTWICAGVQFDDSYCVPEVCNPSLGYSLPCTRNPYCCDEGFTPPCHCEVAPRLCADDCYGKTCPDGFVCVPKAGGQCLSPELGCYVAGCDEGLMCEGGECVADPCSGAACDTDDYCNADGECVTPCLADQCPGQGCFEGQCVDDPCVGLACPSGMSCEDGECVVGSCWGVSCEYWESCENGDCVDDPCWNVDCPDCTLCIAGGCHEYSPGSDGDTDGDTDSDSDSDSGTTGTPAGVPGENKGVIETRCGCHTIGAASPGLLVGLLGLPI